MDEKALGKRLQLARKRAGLTQQELCQKASLSYSTLAKIERGAIRSPSVFTVASIAGATGTPIEDLLDIKSQKLKSPVPETPKKTSKTGVRFVYFDIDGVLMQYVLHAFGRIARDHSLPADRVETTFWRYNDDVCRGDITPEQFNKAIAKELGLKDFDWLAYYLQSAKPCEEAIELLRWAAKYYEVGLLSNHMPGLTGQLLEQGLIPDLGFKTVVDSCDVRAVKPETKIYETATAKAGVTAKEIMFIDDVRANLTTADRLGWQIQWFDSLKPTESAAHASKALAF